MNKQINVTKPSIPSYEEYINEIKPIWESYRLTNFGELHNRLAGQLRDFLGVDNISLFTNGHQALYSILSVMNLKGEVITTPFTFASTTHSIVQCGLTPVFCDIDPITYTMNPELIEPLINDKTCAIMPVHVYGMLCDTESIGKIADKYSLPVIYDAAHAFGVSFKGRGAGTFGTASAFSFHATKAYNSIEGGAVTYGNPLLSVKLKEFINFGLIDGENAESTGINAKMNEFSAAMGICNLRHIGEVLSRRKQIFELYKTLIFERDRNFDPFTGIAPDLGIKMLPVQPDVTPNYAYFPVLFDVDNGCKASRDDVKAALETENIFARRYFYPLTSDFRCYRSMPGASGTPVGKYISNNILALPLYADLSCEDVRRICTVINNII